MRIGQEEPVCPPPRLTPMHMTGTTFDLRPAQPRDLPALSHMLRMIYDRDIAAHNEPQGRSRFFTYVRPADFTARMEQEASDLILAWQGTWLAGCLERQAAHVLLLFVHPHYRCQGLARQLVGHALAALQAQGLPPILTLNAAPNAYSAYVRLGFRPVGPAFIYQGIRARPMRLNTRLAPDNYF